MKKLTGAIGAAFLLASCAPLMQGAIQISYSVDGGAQIVCGNNPNSDGPVTCSASGPGVTIPVLSASSNSPGTALLAEQFGAALLISSTAASTVDIWIAAQGFTAPTTPPAIKYSSTISVTSTAGTGSVNLTSCVDGADGLTPPTTAFCASPEATLNNPAVSYSGRTGGGNTISEIISSLTTTPYSLSSGTYAYVRCWVELEYHYESDTDTSSRAGQPRAARQRSSRRWSPVPPEAGYYFPTMILSQLSGLRK